MSILIKGMAMPHDENDSIHILRDGTAVVYRTGSIDFYKAVSVPNHGDLIDRDAYLEEMNNHIQDEAYFAVANSMPTIIPADKEEDA